jgi:hypothetical protein
MYLINLTLLYPFVAITDMNISRKYIGLINPEYIKFVEDKTTILLYCYAFLSKALKQKESYSL